MGFSIPNEADAFHADQAEPDKVDFDILVAGLAGWGVVSGCAVTAQGTPDMTVAVAAGVITDGTELVTVTAGNVTITTADATNPRIDLITAHGSGTKVCTAGTAAASPVLPAIPSASVALAAVYVPANDTAIGSTQIIDKRVILPAPLTLADVDDPVGDIFGPADTAFEFDTSSLTGLTAIGTPDVEDADTTVPGCLFYQDDTTSTAWMGRFLASPTPPFTAIVKVMDANIIGDYNAAALLVGEDDPTTESFVVLEVAHNTNRKVLAEKFTNRTTYASTLSGTQVLWPSLPIYLAVIVNSTSSIDYLWSFNGRVWRLFLPAADPSLTVGSVGIGFKNEYAGAGGTNAGAAAAFDYLRIWESALTFPGA